MQYPEGHVSRSIYATFKLVSASPTSGGFLDEYIPDVYLAIWTTTPWTIPANAGESFFAAFPKFLNVYIYNFILSS